MAKPDSDTVTVMPAEQFDALQESLDIADKAPTLARACERARQQTQ